MKRFLRFFAAVAASATMLFSCDELEQVAPGILDQIAFEEASYEIGAEGGELKVTVLTTVDWTATIAAATSLDNIEGITLAADSGKGSAEPIQITVIFAANEGFDRTVKLSVTGGKLSGSCTIVQKGTAEREMEQITIAEFLQKPVDASIYYKLRGVITSISNTQYSNFNLKDIDGDAEVYIYGLGYEDDPSNQKVELLVKEGIQEGDIITIASTRGEYNGTIEGMNSYYISHEKSATPMLKLDKETYEASASGEVFDLAVTSNIVTWTLTADVDWLSFEPATGNESTTVKVTVAAGEGGTGTITASADGLDPVTCVVTRADLTVLTIAEFLAKEDDANKAYQIAGIVTDIVMDKTDPTKPNIYGNFYIKDHTGEAYIYGLLPEKGGASGQNVIGEKGIKIGDYVILAAPKSSYNGNPQGKNAWLLGFYPSKTLAEFLALDDDATKSEFYTIGGKVAEIVMDKNDATKPNRYGNIYIVDGEGTRAYIYGVLDWDGKTANFESLGVNVGDNITGFAYKSSYNGSPQAVNLQPVLIEAGEPVVEDKWDYTPSAEYNADLNLWKPVFDANGEKYFYYICDGADWNGTDTETTEVSFLTKSQSTYKVEFEKETTQEWQNQFFIFPNEGHFIPLDANKTYKAKITFGAKIAAKGFAKIVQYNPSGAKHEGALIQEFGRFDIGPDAPKEVEFQEFSGVACDNINFVLDFGPNPAGQVVYIKDIIVEETGVAMLNFGWREDSVAEQTVAFNATGAAHWYIAADKDVAWDAVVKLNGAAVTDGVTVEKFETGGGHIAINYGENKNPAANEWVITVTSTSNVETPTLTAKLTQGAYEYSNLAEFNEAIIAAGTKSVDRILVISADAKLYVTKKNGKNVFAQSRHDWFTGGVLFYGTGLESKVAECNTIYGKVVATTTAFNGVPEITKVTYNEGDVTFGYDDKTWPCEKVLIDALKADYMKYVNVKTELNNNYSGVTITDGFDKTDRTGKVKDSKDEIDLYVQLTDGTITGHVTGTKLNKIIVWPTFYKTNKQVGLWSQPTDVKSIPGIITMPDKKTLEVGATFELGATTNSTATITYASSDEAIATVDEAGLVTAVAAGEATITASVAADGKYLAGTAECVITVSDGESGGGGGETVDPYSIDLTYRLGTNAYDDGVATVNGTENVKVLKIGTSKAAGEFTVIIPAGTKKLTYYAVGWSGKTTTLDFKINGTSVAQQPLVANSGASNNSPFTLTVTDSDKYQIANDFAVETVVTVTTTASARALLFGLKAE